MAIKINIEAVLAQAEQRKLEPKPLPQIFVGKQNVVVGKPAAKVQSVVSEKDKLVSELEHEYAVVLKERKVLSSKTAELVDNIAQRLRKDSGAGAEQAFLNGHVPVPAIREHYEKIEEKSDRLAALYDQIQYVKQHGVMPKEKALVTTVDNNDSVDIKAINYEIRRLGDAICKTEKKIKDASGGLKQPKNSARMLMWKDKKAMCETKIELLKQQLTTLRHESREQRTAAE